MKTLIIKKYGKLSDSLSFEDAEVPEVGENDILIDIHAASINPIDYKTVKGATRLLIPMKLPAKIGFDVSGVVIEKGAKVVSFNIGDEVFARVGGDRPGTLAEKIAVDQKFIARKPKNISHNEAASVPLVGLTTWQAFKKADLKAGQKVLIHAGSGGIGSFAIQLAKDIGATVYTTTSTKNAEWVKALGADRVIDYNKESYDDAVEDVDLVYDTLGGKHVNRSFKVLKKGGKLINLTGPIIDKEAVDQLNVNVVLRFLFWVLRFSLAPLKRRKNIEYRFFLMEPKGSHLQEIADRMEKGKIKAVIDSVFPFDESIQALEKLQTGRAKGKIVIEMK